MRIVGLALVAFVVGVAGSFVHRWASPVGLVLSVGATLGLVLLARAWIGGRVGMSVVALTWLVPVMGLAQRSRGGDLVLVGDEMGLVFVFGGIVGHAISLGAGADDATSQSRKMRRADSAVLRTTTNQPDR